jgi:hypothetical protein
MPPLSKEEQKKLVREAISAWMDERWASFGKWTFIGVAAGGFAALAAYLFGHGWTGPQ